MSYIQGMKKSPMTLWMHARVLHHTYDRASLSFKKDIYTHIKYYIIFLCIHIINCNFIIEIMHVLLNVTTKKPCI